MVENSTFPSLRKALLTSSAILNSILSSLKAVALVIGVATLTLKVVPAGITKGTVLVGLGMSPIVTCALAEREDRSRNTHEARPIRMKDINSPCDILLYYKPYLVIYTNLKAHLTENPSALSC
jgi:hypothetical protein